jgi:hypothetical protein
MNDNIWNHANILYGEPDKVVSSLIYDYRESISPYMLLAALCNAFERIKELEHRLNEMSNT